jgi:hypothetical protein
MSSVLDPFINPLGGNFVAIHRILGDSAAVAEAGLQKNMPGGHGRMGRRNGSSRKNVHVAH